MREVLKLTNMENETGNAGEQVQIELPSWLSLIDATVDAIERTAWDLRGIATSTAEQASELWGDLGRDWQRLEGDVRELGSELASWPSRVERLGTPGWMLGRMAASYRLHPTRAAFLTEQAARASLEKIHARNARRFAATSARQGGGVLKVGQLLSTRPDLLPRSWITELSKLQDAAPAVAFPAVRQRVEEDLGAPLEDLFRDFEVTPVAAASIGQVHRAITHDGVTVAVKVMRPDIHRWIELDLDLMELFLESVKAMFPPADYPTIVAELRSMLRQELNYRAEVSMMERLADFFEDRDDIAVPRSLPELCGRNVLVSQFIEGRKITVVLDELLEQRDAGDATAGDRLDGILSLLLEAYVRQILVAGVFQADPHPGNFLVTDDDRLVLLDFGCTRTLEAPVRDAYLGLLGSFLAGDSARVAEILNELGFATRSGAPETLHAFAELLLSEFRETMNPEEGSAGLDPQAAVARASEVMARSHEDPVIRIPPEFVMLARVLLSLSGLFQHYQPSIDYTRPITTVLFGRPA